MSIEGFESGLSGLEVVDALNKAKTALQEEQYKGTYSKPEGGIPKSDLSEEVKTSLDKANTALQEHQSLNGYATETYVSNAIAQAITTTLNTEV